MTKRLDINDELLFHGRDAVLARDAAATVVHSPKVVELAAARAGPELPQRTRAPPRKSRPKRIRRLRR